jgi:hypothetical protein
MRVLFAVLATYPADQPGGFDGALMADGADIAPAREATLRQRWRKAVAQDTAREFAARLRGKLAKVGREGGKQPLMAAATVALLCEVGELEADRNNGT